MNRLFRRTIDVGVALGGGRCVALPIGGNSAWSSAIDDSELLAGRWEELETGLSSLRESIGAAAGQRVRMHVALLPPLIDARLLRLPRLSAEESRMLVAANSRRYFPSASGSDAIGIDVSNPEAILGVSAPLETIERLEEVVGRAGCELERAVPAVSAWAASGTNGWLAAAVGESVVAVRSEGGRVQELRRFAAGTTPDGLAAALAAEPEVIDPWLTAAQNAGRVALPEIASQGTIGARYRRRRRRAGGLAAAALACTLASGAVYAFGLAAEVRAVRAQRGEVRAQVQAAMSVRETLDRIEAHVASLDRSIETAPSWTGTIASLARALPQDAHVISLSLVQDSMAVEVVSANAASAFEAIRGIPGVRSVTALGPVRREEGPEGVITEQIRLAARLDREEALP